MRDKARTESFGFCRPREGQGRGEGSEGTPPTVKVRIERQGAKPKTFSVKREQPVRKLLARYSDGVGPGASSCTFTFTWRGRELLGHHTPAQLGMGAKATVTATSVA